MKSLRMKLFTGISMFVIALSMLIIGVWAVGETQHINLSGNVDFTISDNNLYIKDIRFRDAGSSEQGTTIDNFIPGFVKSSFELNLGSFDVDSDFDLIIDVVNTTTTIYEVDTSFDISNGTVIASGRIEGDGVPLTEVSTADISGQIILSVTITSAGTVSIDQVDVPLTEYIPKVYEYFTFEPNSDGKTVTLTAFDQSKADTTDIVIPAKVDLVDGVWQDGNTYTVTAIANASSYSNGVFYDSGITSVTFPSSLTSIGRYAFYRCSGLTSISLPSSLKSIEHSAFYSCSGLTGELNLGECTNLTSIGIYAFDYCSKLTSISLPSSLTSIGSFAFERCSGLTGTVTIPASVTSIGDNPFADCSNLEGIAVEEGNSGYYIEGNCLIESSTKTLITGFNNSTIPSDIKIIGDWAFYDCSGLTGELNLGGCTSLTSIGSYAFWYCSKLTSISLPSNLTSIGYMAFYSCSGLTSISLPSSLTSIGRDAFGYCSGLTSVDLSGCTNLTSIGNNAFSGCSGLTGTVTIPASVTEIGKNPFASCRNLEGIVVEKGNSEYYIEGNCLIEKSTKTLIIGFNNSTIPSDIKIIGGYAFYGCSGLTGVDLSGCTSLTSIESFAIYGCSALKSVVFPEGSTGWYVTTSSTATSGTPVDVTNSSTNANNLTGQYCTYYWKRG